MAFLLLLALAAPFVASVVHAESIDWRPSGDEALIALRVNDVTAGDLPTTGQPSTADQYDDGEPPRHPGPIEFYLLRPPTALLGFDLGMLLGAATFSFAGVATAVWVAFRRGGPAVGLGAAVICSLIAFSEGQAVLTAVISSSVGGIPLLALAALAWALLDGDIRLVPLAAFVFAFVCQAHLAILGLAAGTAAWAAVGIVWYSLAWYRGRTPAGAEVPDRATGNGSPWPWLAGGLAVTLVAWAPVLGDQFFGGGNLSRIVSFAGSSDRPRLGLASGITQAGRALGFPPLLLRTNLGGGDITAPLGAVGATLAVLVAGTLVAIIVTRWRTCRTHAWLAATTLVVAAVGAWNGANVPKGFEEARIAFYRWTFVVSAGAVASLMWAAAAALARQWPQSVRRPIPALSVAAVALVMVVGGVAIAVGGPVRHFDEQVFPMEDRISAAALPAVAGQHKVLLVQQGNSAVIATGPALALRLVEDGHEIRVPATMVDFYGRHRVIDPGEQVDTVLELTTQKGPLPTDSAGTTLLRADLNADAREVITSLAARFDGRAPVRGPRDRQALADAGVQPGSGEDKLLQAFLTTSADDPDTLLRNPLVVRLFQTGYFSSPELPKADLAELADANVTDSWGDDHFGLRELTPAQAEQAYGITLG